MSDYIHHMLGDQEEIIFTTRPHWLVYMRTILIELVFIILILIGASFAFPLTPLAWLGYFLLVIPLASMIVKLMTYANHQFIITNRRVIQISGVVNKNVTDSSLEKVNDVKLTQSFFGRILDFGDIEILTASEMGVNQFKLIAKPIQFKTSMLNAKEGLEYVDHNGVGVSSHPKNREDIPSLIAKLDELRKKGVLSEAEFQAKKEELLKEL
jgi:uncharacterized membrane protein YdbT with pleckstrin-like domain